MEFGFVVGYHSLTKETEKVIAGFLNINESKDYAERKELDYIANIYMYVDTAEGRYILGADKKNEKEKWYEPSEKAFVYDSSKDTVISLD